MGRTCFKNKEACIYQISSVINNRKYIGSAVIFHKRKNEHLNHLKNKKHGNIHLQRHYNKHGVKDLSFHIIEFCEKENLIKREQFWMDKINPKFNICKIAASSLGTKRTEESKDKMRGKNNPMYGVSRTGKDASNYGNKASAETKLKMSKSHKLNPANYWEGKEMSKETKKKMSEAHSGSNNSFFGKSHTQEAKEKISKSRAGKKMSEETKNKKRISMLAFYNTKAGKLNILNKSK